MKHTVLSISALIVWLGAAGLAQQVRFDDVVRNLRNPDPRARLSALVTGNTYRNPAMLAKTVTTLDVISGGRAQLGIGAGWFELEHDAFGIEFGTFADRFEKLEEALQIILPMLRG